MNTRLDDEKYCLDNTGIYRSTERKNTTGYSLFSFKQQNQAYVEDENDIFIEGDIVKAISFIGGISGTTSVHVDAVNFFGEIAFKENQFQNKNWGTGNT